MGWKGAGKSGSGEKGGGKGKGPMYGSCWNCGGAHHAKECPKGKGKGFGKKGQVRSVDEHWPAADFGVGKLCCLRDGKGARGKEMECLLESLVSSSENRPVGSVAGSPVSDCNKLEEDAEERSYRGDGLLLGNSPDQMSVSNREGEEMPNLEDSESEEEKETEKEEQEESEYDSDTENEQNDSKIRICSNYFCGERRCGHGRCGAYFVLKMENIKNNRVGGQQVEEQREE